MIRRRSAIAFASLVLLAGAVQAAKKPEARPFELQVVDPAENPLPGALVTMKAPDGTMLELTLQGLTDDAGKVAGHSSTKTTAAVYDRAALEAAERFADARVKRREATGRL